MPRIFVTGDTHRDYDLKKLYVANFPQQEDLTKEDYVIICGDFGGVWTGKNDDKAILERYDKFNFTTLFCDGNHENHDLLNSFPVEEWNGGKVHKISKSIIHLMRGQIYTINQKKFFVLGGAQSMDRMYRIEGKSWWKSEEVNAAEIEEAFANLDANNWKVDYVITHCAPCGAGLYRKNCETERVLGVIEADLKYKDWFAGHYHTDRDYGNLHLLYDTIIELQI